MRTVRQRMGGRNEGIRKGGKMEEKKEREETVIRDRKTNHCGIKQEDEYRLREDRNMQEENNETKRLGGLSEAETGNRIEGWVKRCMRRHR